MCDKLNQTSRIYLNSDKPGEVSIKEAALQRPDLQVSCSDQITPFGWARLYHDAMDKFSDLNAYIGMTDRNIRVDEQAVSNAVCGAFMERGCPECQLTIVCYPNLNILEVWMSVINDSENPALSRKPVKIYSGGFLQ